MTWTIPNSLKGEVRRVLGYPAPLSEASLTLGYPGYASQYAMYQPYAILEQKMAYLENAPADAVPIFGANHPLFGTYYTAASLTIPLATSSSPAVGATVTVSFAGVTASGVAASSDTVLAVAQKLVTAIAAQPPMSALVVAQAQAVDSTHANVVLYATSAGSAGNGIAIVTTTTDPSLTASSLGPVFAGVTSGGQNPPGPTATVQGVVLYGYLPVIQSLENDLGTSSKRLGYSKAEVTFRADELGQRSALLFRYRRELADRLGVKIDPDIVGNRRSRMRCI